MVGVFVMLFVTKDALRLRAPSDAQSVANQPEPDRLIVPGERIGPLRLNETLAGIRRQFGDEASRDPEDILGYEFAKSYAWPTHGFFVIADDATGNLLGIGIQNPLESHPWSGVATKDGVGLGSTEGEIRATRDSALAVASTESGVRGLTFPRKGIGFYLLTNGPLAGRVARIVVFWRLQPPGDAVAVPGVRISSITLGMTAEQVLSAGGGGYQRVKKRGRDAYFWPHNQLIAVGDGGRVDLVRGIWSPLVAAMGIRFVTPEGVGYGSTVHEMKAAYGEPSECYPTRLTDECVYRSLGIGFGASRDADSQPGRISEILVFPKR